MEGCALSLIRTDDSPERRRHARLAAKGEMWMCFPPSPGFCPRVWDDSASLAWGSALECIRRSKCIAHSSGPDDTPWPPTANFPRQIAPAKPCPHTGVVTVTVSVRMSLLMSLALVCLLLPVLARHIHISTSRYGVVCRELTPSKPPLPTLLPLKRSVSWPLMGGIAWLVSQAWWRAWGGHSAFHVRRTGKQESKVRWMLRRV